jgi:hypothetical protein
MNRIIKLISVDRKRQKYLKQFNTDSLEKLSLEQGNQFFIKIIQDFKDGKLTLDELSVFGHNIFHAIGKKYPKSDLFQASLFASELNFSVRSGIDSNNTLMYLEEIEKIFLKYEN